MDRKYHNCECKTVVCCGCLLKKLDNGTYSIILTAELEDLRDEIKRLEDSVDFFQEERRYTH